MIATAKDEIIKDDILKEAQKLFQQFGLKKTTMEDIARSMGKGKSTLYYYYCSKEEIFDAVIVREMQEVFNLVKSNVDKEITAEKKLTSFALTKIKVLQKRANLYRIVKGEIQESVRCMKHLYTAYDLQETNLVKEILSFGLQNNEFTPAIRTELDLLPSVIVSSLRGLERDMFISDRYHNMETRLGSIITIMIRGLKK
ncbi:TetR/AcrR family transcriptional regulator [Sediminibacterium ginsengisoli]|uniref:DNA-binding transcriptional regulator, AcrR family n=1 Tax=Sediminibacterium ginsengisoli TaxID=413434 RepID=A0A1T4RHW0_9BACT|nr:TetR/AcrR family transcriptional regulator [Sediminibacterium ginsengisoli]SKA15261.1 DNA-binding transcriptional regulator, AcrR family [Sediminibacterium ginsengisoli]